MYNAIIEKRNKEADIKRFKGYKIGMMKLESKKNMNKKEDK